jgi:hypothetical protein
MRLALIVSTLLCAGAIGCGAARVTAPARPTSPFTDMDLKLFDDGVDLVADPDALAGQWGDDWNLEMRDRVARSDLIALVEVRTFRSDTDPESRTTHRLSVGVDRVLKGKPPADELDLATPDSAAGYPTIDSNKGRLLHMTLLVLVKWVETNAGTVGSHFHLVAASDKIVARVQAHIERDRPQDRTVIERRYDSSKGEQ